MIFSIQGKINTKTKKSVIIETGGIGYRVFCSPVVIDKIPVNKEIKIFTRLLIKKEELQLYGFVSHEELELFNVLEGISGVGPKTALMLSCFNSLEKLKKAIESGKPLAGVKGIGKKRFQRIILELTGKIKEIEGSKTKERIEEKDDALDGLKSLGFSGQEAKTALLEVSPEIKEPEAKIKIALKILGKR